MSDTSARRLMVVASLARLTYALGMLVAPHEMNRRNLGADTRGNPLATMTTRGFGAVHVNVALMSLRAALGDGDRRAAAQLNLGCDLGDFTATMLESRFGELEPAHTAASVALQTASLAAWTAVLRETR